MRGVSHQDEVFARTVQEDETKPGGELTTIAEVAARRLKN
jgi:hypothetical protein